MVTTQHSADEYSSRDVVRDERRDERSSIKKLFLESNRLTKFDERTSDIIPNSMDECNLKNVHWLQLRTQPTNIVREMQFEMNIEMNVVRSRNYFQNQIH